MEKIEELKGLVTELCKGQIAKSLEEQKAKDYAWQTEFAKKSQTEQNELKSRVEAIEKLPLQKQKMGIPGTSEKGEIVYGFKANRQFADIMTGQRLVEAKGLVVNPEVFPVVADAEKRSEFAKHLLMIISAAMGNNKARADYDNWLAKTSDMVEGTGNVGGFLVPTQYETEILMFSRLKSFALNECRIWPMASEVMLVPREDQRVSVAWKSEGEAAAQTNPVFGQVQLIARKLTSYAQVTNELLQDSFVDIVSYLTELFAWATGQELDNQVLNGTGNPVSGIFVASGVHSVVMPSGSSGFSDISADDFVKMMDTIDQQAEDNCKFYFHKNTLNLIRQLKDKFGQYLFGPLSGPVPNDLWSYPYVRTPKAPALSDSTASKAFAVFGNMRYFILGRRMQGITLDVDPWGKFLENETRFRILHRWGLAVGKADAFCKLVTHS